MKKTNGSWRMTMHYHKPNQVVTSIATSVPDWSPNWNYSTHSLIYGTELLNWKMLFLYCLVRTIISSLVSFEVTFVYLSCLMSGLCQICGFLVKSKLQERWLVCLYKKITLVTHFDDIMLFGHHSKKYSKWLRNT